MAEITFHSTFSLRPNPCSRKETFTRKVVVIVNDVGRTRPKTTVQSVPSGLSTSPHHPVRGEGHTDLAPKSIIIAFNVYGNFGHGSPMEISLWKLSIVHL